MLAYSIFRHTQVVIPEVIHFPQGFTDQFQRCQMGNWGYGHHVFEKRPYVCERCASIGTPKEMEQWISPAKSSKPYIYVYLFIYNIYIYTNLFGDYYMLLLSLWSNIGGVVSNPIKWWWFRRPEVLVWGAIGPGVGSRPVKSSSENGQNMGKSSVKTIQDNCNPKRGFSLWQFYISVTSNRARVLKLWVERGARLTIPN